MSSPSLPMNYREECLSCDADYPELSGSVELTAEEMRWLLKVLRSHFTPREYRPMSTSIEGRLECAIENIERGDER